MPLPRAQTKTPTAIEDISVELYEIDDGAGTYTRGANYSVQVRYSDGDLRVLTGDLVPYLTQQQITGLLNFMTSLRTQAEREILP